MEKSERRKRNQKNHESRESELKKLKFDSYSEDWLDFFYHSEVYQLIRDGVSDMHCMSDSDAHLAEELEQEYSQNNANSINTADKVPIKCRQTAGKVLANEENMKVGNEGCISGRNAEVSRSLQF